MKTFQFAASACGVAVYLAAHVSSSASLSLIFCATAALPSASGVAACCATSMRVLSSSWCTRPSAVSPTTLSW